MTVLLSPCLFLKDGQIQNLAQLCNVLSFTDNYLDAEVDVPIDSVLSEDKWFSFPTYQLSVFNQFSTMIVPLLSRISKMVPTKNAVKTTSLCKLQDSLYICTDEQEMEYLFRYLSDRKDVTDLLLFVGNINFQIGDELALTIDGDLHKLPIVKDPWLDETGHFDTCISENVKDYTEPFPCKCLCTVLGEQTIEIGNKSLYHKYGGIIAKRNGFSKCSYTSQQYKNVPYYIRDDKKFSISIDDLHGTFEVFVRTHGDSYDYKGEYDFSCNEITNKKSSNENHKHHK